MQAHANKKSVKASSSTAEPAIVNPSVMTSNTPAPTALAPTSAISKSRLLIESLPKPSNPPVGLQGPFEAPNLIISVDKADPSKIIGNGYVAHLSPTIFTVFVFDVRPENQGKTCNLTFHMPVALPWPDMSPVKVRSPGGITISSVDQQVTSMEISANDVSSSSLVGWVPSVEPANQYNIASVPCAAGQRIAYQVESTGGFTMDFFQTTTPPLGLFMSVS
jgi:hypothetical protein